MKVCTRCKQDKPLDDFRRGRGYKNGIRSNCKDCDRLRLKEWRRTHPEQRKAQTKRRNEKQKKYQSGFYDPDPEKRAIYQLKSRDAHLRRKYGITLDEYNALHDAQGGVCAGCRRVAPNGKNLCLDHDHQTGRARGLLCDDCNSTLARALDSPATLRRLADYLEL